MSAETGGQGVLFADGDGPRAPAAEVEIREAIPEDTPAIAGLIARCPEAGAVTFGFRLVGGLDGLRGRFETRRLHLARSLGRVVGMVASDVGPVLVSGRRVVGARLSFLRTDPAQQRRGIARALLQRAEQDARSLDGARVFWGHVMDGNRASHATLARAGYLRGPSGQFKFLDPRRCGAPTPGLRLRRARDADLPWLVAALEARHARHDFWRSFTVDEYRKALGRWVASGGDPRLWIAEGAEERPLAAALAYGNGHALANVVEKARPLLRLASALARLPIVLGQPLRIATVADVVADPAAPAGAATAVLRQAVRDQRGVADFVVVIRHANDSGDPAYRALYGVSSPVDVVYKAGSIAKAGLAAGRPAYIDPW